MACNREPVHNGQDRLDAERCGSLGLRETQDTCDITVADIDRSNMPTAYNLLTDD
jgi:hypothetical protein